MPVPEPLLSHDVEPTPPVTTPRPSEFQPVFTGDGSEYFRIWVVNTLLTLATLGVYSAWAKVRRTRYLWQNTRLDGFVFDYHARPIAILRGRILALALFAYYTYAFEFSLMAGYAALLVVCVVGPWLLMRSQQFKFANTSWRGLRFGFDAYAPEAFRIVFPILVLWFSGTLAAVWYPTEPGYLLGAQLPAILGIPWMHHRLKAYQHGRARYGDLPFFFHSVLLRFYATYAKGLVLIAAGTIAGTACMIFLIDWASESMTGPGSNPVTTPIGFLSVLLFGLAIYLFSWPYLAARIQQTVWSNTRLGDIRFRTQISAGALFRLTARNVFLTLATLGLYWPYASIRLARYRIECMRVESETPLETIAADTHVSSVGAMGEGALDSFGLDLGL
jgi:uncharacterized membrane protein YjgN (DUF898 family)